MSDQIPEDLQHFQKDFEKAEKKVAGEIDPGMRSVGIAVAILLLLASFLLPHTGSVNGWDVLVHSDAAQGEAVAITSQLFVWFALVFGALTGMITLLTRRWTLAWVTAAGCAVGIFLGVLAIWSRQTPSGVLNAQDAALANLSGPGIGIVVGLILLIVLTYLWVGVAWSKTSLQLAAEEERRQHAAEDEDAWMHQARLGRPETPDRD
ncbi:hypothetical protein [Tomitella fengzijianii]|uniref:Uncharacterized protein n=1 Tax=Tomitella fengzijianii TaxID=2597660 RepID=A0A516X3J9_9ACTN|nr:hypothetical protein [Tomitella fengzijianii]QDQ97637.1 hypothetical protein FO059_10270 [Tomitella fengzijianii]